MPGPCAHVLVSKRVRFYMDERIARTLANLNKNNMKGYFVSNKYALIELLTKLIENGHTVGCGDSVTLQETGVIEFLREGDFIFLDKYSPNLTAEEKRNIYIANFSADTFVTGTNAVTVDGKLFNIDGNGSRVAPMIYGPGQVIVIVGKNKITEDVGSAITRARQIAAPLDAKRLQKATPCVSLGKCVDCHHPQRICNDFVLITGQFIKDRIKVVVMDMEIGY